MNTNKLKKFAQAARLKLRLQIAAKLDYITTADSAYLREQAQAKQVLDKELTRIGREKLIEKVAYTWFNRLVALRFMDANDYQPTGTRIVSPREGYVLPQILEEAKQGTFPEGLPLDESQILDILDGKAKSSNPQNEAYQYLLIGACNALHQQFPFLFERINDYAALLLPDDLTSEYSIVHDVLQGMSAEDCQAVEIIGWLYQFYISERKDEVFAAKSKVAKEDIPAATQLFTPRWIVEYMVQNTLGKLWLQNRPNSKVREHMPYFIESAAVEGEEILKVDSVEDIRLLDQACGSGHILVYAFELLSKIYEEEGYNPSEIPKYIIEQNLHGFEIDERAAQLAGFALLMKARAYYRRLFRKEIRPNILYFRDIAFAEGELEGYLEKMPNSLFNQDLIADLRYLENATNFGALIRPRTADLPSIAEQLPESDMFTKQTHEKVLAALAQLAPLSQKYHCVVDNPPYMGGGKMNKTLADFVKANYPDSKADLMAAFMEVGLHALQPKGFLGMINQHSWMFLSSYETFRKTLLQTSKIDTLVQVGYNSFPELNSKVVQAASFVIKKSFTNKNIGIYYNLNDAPQSANKREVFEEKLKEQQFFETNQQDFEKIPGSPIGYWLSEDFQAIFGKGRLIREIASPVKGLDTGRDDQYLKKWSELDLATTQISNVDLSTRWFFYKKGGAFRKWFGNGEYLVMWEDDGDELKNFKNENGKLKSRPQNVRFYFKKGLEWSRITSSKLSLRILENSIFGGASSALFLNKESKLYYLLGFINSVVAENILEVLNPTLVFQVGDVKRMPLIIDKNINENIDLNVKKCIQISKKEWNSRETSWDFEQNELLRLRSNPSDDIKISYKVYQAYWKEKFYKLHQNEEELNRQFIDIYGLADELTPDVPLQDITLLKAERNIIEGELTFNAKEVFAQFISYAVGCMMGRYSLDKTGLVLANAGETMADYHSKVGTTSTSNFLPDDDGIVPVLNDDWFEDDIVGQFYAFLKATFGELDFQKNLHYIEEQLGMSLRRYFIKEFHNDHIKRYKKRPIYWLCSSPKGTFQALIYLHRYTPDTLNNLLNNYLREFVQKLKAQKAHQERLRDTGTSREQNEAVKAIDKLDKMLLDCEEYERDILYPLATERIALDLDDGVLVNYNKLGTALKEVKGLNDAKAKAKVRKFDWIETKEIRD